MDPFHIEGPAVISFSGGRTSGLMLRRVLDAHGGTLPANVHVVFANTGLEREETLRFVDECASRWGVEIRWVERRPRPERFAEVTFETASRDGEPFAALIGEKRYLPNAVTRHCTEGLKLEVMRSFMLAQGHEHWTNVVGLRADEPARVARVRARIEPRWDSVCPLADARVTAADVAAFWRAQPFDLGLRAGEGNCNLCFLKGRALREHLVAARPQDAAWWIAQEARVGARFHAHERGYADLLDRARRQLPLVFDADALAASTIPCTCTDRRASRRCGCRNVRRVGHPLACVFARAA